MNFCPKCGVTISGASTDSTLCPMCGFPTGSTIASSIAPEVQFEQTTQLAWEQISTRGILNSFLETIKESLLRPKLFYSRLGKAKRSPLMAVLFAIIICSLSQMAMLGITSLLPSSWSNILSNAFPVGKLHKNELGTDLLFFPLAIIAGMIFLAAYFHMCTTIFGVINRKFSTTLAMLCYMESTSVAIIIPVIGPAIAVIWSFVLMVIAFHHTYKISTGRALALVIVPPIMLIFLLGALVAVLFAIGLSGSNTDLLKEILSSFR